MENEQRVNKLQATEQEVKESRMKLVNIKIKAAFKLEETIMVRLWEGNIYNKNSEDNNKSKKEENQDIY